MNNRLMNGCKLVLGWPLSLLALFFIGKFIFSQGFSLVRILTSLNILLLALGIIFFLLYFFFRGLFWHRLLEKSGFQFSLLHSLYTWSIAELKRYIPGNIWGVIGRTSAYQEKGIPIKKTLILQTQEVMYMGIATLLLASFSINFIIYGILSGTPYAIFLSYAIPSVIVLLCVSFLFNQYILTYKLFPISLLRLLFPKQSPWDMGSMLLSMLAAFTCFGLGTYFSISSISLLFPDHVVSLIGFFAASFLIGFISFITPMGLGVREGIVTIGIAKYFFSLQKAALGALLARLCLIISELLFLGVLLILYKIPAQIYKKTNRFLKKHRYTILLTVAISFYVLYFTTLSFYRYTNFYTGRFDLGNMDQTVWNTLHGRIFQLTDPDGTNIISRLAIHADFILVLLAPLYGFWQDPRMLLFIQTTVLASGAIFLYLLGKDLLKSKPIALLISICYLLNPAVEHSNLYDFHSVVLATTFLLGAFYFLQKKKFLYFLLFGVLAAVTKEEAWAVVGLFGLYDIFVNKTYIRGFLTLVSGIGISYYIVDKLIPLARGGDHFALSFYADLGSTPIGILKTVLLSPQKVLPILVQNGRPLYIVQLFAPFGFLPLLSPLLLIFAIPDLMVNLLSKNSQYHQIYLHYTATISPFLFIATIYSLRFIKGKFSQTIMKSTCLLLTVATIISAYTFGPLFGSLHPNLDMITHPQPNQEEIENFLSIIPKKYSVAATNNLGSHLSHRQKIYTIPTGLNNADVIVFLLTDEFAQPSLKAQKEMTQDLMKNPEYVSIFSKGDFYVFEKKSLMYKPRVHAETTSPFLFSLGKFLHLQLF